MELNINIDHVATVRQARGGSFPNPTEVALLSERAGADGIVCHLREDRRHIQDSDVYELREKISTRLDLEMACVEEIIKIALDVKPELVTIVPEKREELTTEGGLLISLTNKELINLCDRMHAQNIIVSFFIEPNIKDIELSKEIGADMVELHTGNYANLFGAATLVEAEKIKKAADYAKSIGLKVAAGHGLNYNNTHTIAKISSIDELSIGHSIMGYSMSFGIENAVKDMKTIINQAGV